MILSFINSNNIYLNSDAGALLTFGWGLYGQVSYYAAMIAQFNVYSALHLYLHLSIVAIIVAISRHILTEYTELLI